MILYYCNFYSIAKYVAPHVEKDVPMLFSYMDVKKKTGVRPFKPLACASKHFLDSGAFGAYSKGTPIALDDYIEYLHLNADKGITEYAGLDVIGDPAATYANQLEMEKQGLSAIPTFHFGEDLKWLKKYAGEHDRIALGGMVPIKRRSSLVSFLNQCFRALAEVNPKCKVHGFGVQDLNLVRRFPFYSVDAGTAHRLACFGGAIVGPDGKPLCITNGATQTAGAWLLSRPRQKEIVRKWVCELCPGVNFEEAQDPGAQGAYRRCAINIAYFEREVAAITKERGRLRIKGDFGARKVGFFDDNGGAF